MASNDNSSSEIIFSQYESSLGNGDQIQTEWLDMYQIDKVQFSGFASSSGMTMTIDSRAHPDQTALSTPVTYTDGTFYMFNIICRQRFMRFTWANNTGSTVTNVSMEVKQTYGSSDKLSVFPVGVQPTEFSQAALVQAISRGRQPDGDYVAIPADGSALSTSTTLGADQTFTSSWVDSDGWSTIEIFFDSDVPSAFQGIEIEFTNDSQAETPIAQGSIKYTFTDEMVANGYEIIRLPTLLDGFRVKYTNGPDAQSSFFLDATLRTNTSNDKYNKGGGLLVADFETEVSLGFVSGYVNDTKHGIVKLIDAADPAVDIWSFSTDTQSPRVNTKTFPTSASTFYLASTSTSDTAVQVFVEYIDSDGYAAETTITLNGQTGVSLGASALDVNRMRVTGSASAVGAIYCITANNFTAGAPATPSQCVSHIPVGQGQSQQSMLTVPRGKKLIIRSYDVYISRASGAAGSADVSLRIKNFGEISAVKRPMIPTTSVPTTKLNTSIVVTERAQVVWRLDDVSDNDTNCSVAWSYDLVDL